MRRAETQSGFRHATTGRRRYSERDTEIHYHRAAVVQQNILRLDVAMDHAVSMRVIECVGHFARNAHRFVDTELCFAIQLFANGFALNVGHDVKQKSIRRAAIEQRQNVRMLQRRRGLDLDDESLGTQHGREFRLQYFDRDFALVLQVVREIHGRHAARTEFTLDAVAIGESGGEAS